MISEMMMSMIPWWVKYELAFAIAVMLCAAVLAIAASLKILTGGC